ncbi:hypothetical protein D3C72_1987680 [compost metagenome]
MGDGDRPAARDLRLELRYHAARAAQHVAKADHLEAGLAAAAVQDFTDHFRHPLGGAHDIGGIDRLVR